MQFEIDDDHIISSLEDLDEWANNKITIQEQELTKLDVIPQFLTPQDFWKWISEHGDDEASVLQQLFASLAEDNSSSVTTVTTGNREENGEEEQEQQLNLLKNRLEACELLLSHIGRALNDLDLLESQHKLVADKTHSLHEVCKRLLAEQTRLDRVVAGIQAPMGYFASYEEIAPRFGIQIEQSHNAANVNKNKPRILHPDDSQFKRDLIRLDECIAFLEAHPHYHDQATYMKKFKGLQLHAMTMIKNWLVEEIVKLSDSVGLQTKIQQNQLQNTTGGTSALLNSSFLDNTYLYSRFAEKGKVLRPSIMELEKRPNIAFSVLRESMAKLCSLRYKLLKNLVASSPEIQSKDPSIVSRILNGAAFLGRVCAAEFALVSCFFSLSAARQIFAAHIEGQASMDGEENVSVLRNIDDDDEYDDSDSRSRTEKLFENGDSNPFFDEIESLCSCLYDELRPIIVKENDLENLCDASSSIDSAIQDLEARMDRDAVEPLERVLTRIAFDIQERLVFCVIRVIRDQVTGFSPTNDIIENPSGLARTSNAASGQPAMEVESWYPTLKLTLSTLSKVYHSVEPVVFEQLATECVSACTKSLCDASKQISKKVGQDEALLFLIKHLLILREQISPFRAALSVKEARLDFGSTSRALRQLFSQSAQGKRSDFVNLLKFATPTVKESDFDTKKELDNELKRASETFILRISKRALGPLLEFVDASQAFLQLESATWEGLTAQEFASHKSVKNAVEYCEKEMTSQIGAAKEKAALFIANQQTRSVLFNAVETNAFKVTNSASNFALDLFKDDVQLNDRLRELVRQVGSMRSITSASPTSSFLLRSPVISPRSAAEPSPTPTSLAPSSES